MNRMFDLRNIEIAITRILRTEESKEFRAVFIEG